MFIALDGFPRWHPTSETSEGRFPLRKLTQHNDVRSLAVSGTVSIKETCNRVASGRWPPADLRHVRFSNGNRPRSGMCIHGLALRSFLKWKPSLEQERGAARAGGDDGAGLAGAAEPQHEG